MEFNFSIKNDKLTSVAYPKGVTGNVNTYTCRFDIECDIAGLIWFCIFKQGDNVYNQIIEDNTCIMPYEVLTNAEPLYIGCYGTNADDDIKRVSTNFICFDVKQGAYSEADAPEIPTPDVWESLINKNVPYIGDNGNWFIYDIEQKKYIDSGYKSQGDKGDTGEQGLQGPKGDKGDTGYTPIKGVDYFTSADIESLGIDQKQDKLTFDDIPTADSTNPVTSGGVKTALDEKADKTEVETVEQTANYARDTANTLANKIFSTTDGLDTKADKADLTDYLKITDINSAVRSVRPAVKNTIDTIAVNTIYDLGVQTELNITLPSGQIGDFIEFDFISGETATNLTVNSSSGLVGFDLIPGANTIYTLYFDWGVAGYDGTSLTYGWRCNYSEYSIDV